MTESSPRPPGSAAPERFELVRNAEGRLQFSSPAVPEAVVVVPVRAFPITAPEAGLSLVSEDGREMAYAEQLAVLPAAQRALVEEAWAQREFTPEIQRIVSVSTFSTPSNWQVETDRGPATLVLKVEEDIRRLPGRGRLLIACSHGIHYQIADFTRLDRSSRRLLERFL